MTFVDFHPGRHPLGPHARVQRDCVYRGTEVFGGRDFAEVLTAAVVPGGVSGCSGGVVVVVVVGVVLVVVVLVVVLVVVVVVGVVLVVVVVIW